MSIRQWLALIDASGILLFTLALVTLLIGLLSVNSAGDVSTWHLLTGGIGIIALVIFIRHELKAATPFIPLRTFARYPEMTWVNVQYMLVNILFYALFWSSYVLEAGTSSQRSLYRNEHASLGIVFTYYFSDCRALD